MSEQPEQTLELGDGVPAETSPREPQPTAAPTVEPEEYEGMTDEQLPEDWRPLPILRLRNVSAGTTESDVRDMLEARGLKVKSIVYDPETAVPGPPVALARLAPLKLPWLVTEEDLSHPVVKDAPMPAAQEPQQEQAVPKEDAAAAAGTQECGSAPSSTQPPVVPRVVLADGRKGGDVFQFAAHVAAQLMQGGGTVLGAQQITVDAPALHLTLFLGNLGDTSTEELQAQMAEFGPTERCFVLKGRSGRSKGYGFVEFSLPKSARTAKHELELRWRAKSDALREARRAAERQAREAQRTAANAAAAAAAAAKRAVEAARKAAAAVVAPAPDGPESASKEPDAGVQTAGAGGQQDAQQQPAIESASTDAKEEGHAARKGEPSNSTADPSSAEAKEEAGAAVKGEPQSAMQVEVANGADGMQAAAPMVESDEQTTVVAVKELDASPADNQPVPEEQQQQEIKAEDGVHIKTEDLQEDSKGPDLFQARHVAPDKDAEAVKPEAAGSKTEDQQQMATKDEGGDAEPAKAEAAPGPTPPTSPPSTTLQADPVAAAEAAAAAAAARAQAAEAAAAEAMAASQSVEEEVHAHMFRAEFADLPAVTGLFSKTLYITGLAAQSLQSDADLRQAMEGYGPLTHLNLARGVGGHIKGFAFVEFTRSHHAEEAMYAINAGKHSSFGPRPWASFQNPAKAPENRLPVRGAVAAAKAAQLRAPPSTGAPVSDTTPNGAPVPVPAPAVPAGPGPGSGPGPGRGGLSPGRGMQGGGGGRGGGRGRTPYQGPGRGQGRGPFSAPPLPPPAVGTVAQRKAMLQQQQQQQEYMQMLYAQQYQHMAEQEAYMQAAYMQQQQQLQESQAQAAPQYDAAAAAASAAAALAAQQEYMAQAGMGQAPPQGYSGQGFSHQGGAPGMPGMGGGHMMGGPLQGPGMAAGNSSAPGGQQGWGHVPSHHQPLQQQQLPAGSPYGMPGGMSVPPGVGGSVPQHPPNMMSMHGHQAGMGPGMQQQPPFPGAGMPGGPGMAGSGQQMPGSQQQHQGGTQPHLPAGQWGTMAGSAPGLQHQQQYSHHPQYPPHPQQPQLPGGLPQQPFQQPQMPVAGAGGFGQLIGPGMGGPGVQQAGVYPPDMGQPGQFMGGGVPGQGMGMMHPGMQPPAYGMQQQGVGAPGQAGGVGSWQGAGAGAAAYAEPGRAPYAVAAGPKRPASGPPDGQPAGQIPRR